MYSNYQIKKVESEINKRCRFSNGVWTYRFNDGSELYFEGNLRVSPARMMRFSGDDYKKAFIENIGVIMK